MNKIIILAAISMSIVSCVKINSGESIIPNYNADLDVFDPSLVPYLEDAEDLLEYTSGVQALRFIDESEMEGLKETVVGICILPKNVILLKRSTWDRATEDWRMALIIHELGHCDFLKEHSAKSVDDDCNDTIMHPRATCAFHAFNNLTDEHIKKEIK